MATCAHKTNSSVDNQVGACRGDRSQGRERAQRWMATGEPTRPSKQVFLGGLRHHEQEKRRLRRDTRSPVRTGMGGQRLAQPTVFLRVSAGFFSLQIHSKKTKAKNW